MGVSPMLHGRNGHATKSIQMAAPTKKRVIVVGGGLAGLACTIKLAEEGVPVDLFSMVPVKRSHSVCAQGGRDIDMMSGYQQVHTSLQVTGRNAG